MRMRVKLCSRLYCTPGLFALSDNMPKKTMQYFYNILRPHFYTLNSCIEEYYFNQQQHLKLVQETRVLAV